MTFMPFVDFLSHSIQSPDQVEVVKCISRLNSKQLARDPGNQSFEASFPHSELMQPRLVWTTSIISTCCSTLCYVLTYATSQRQKSSNDHGSTADGTFKFCRQTTPARQWFYVIKQNSRISAPEISKYGHTYFNKTKLCTW